MDEHIEKWLFDIQIAIEEIENFLAQNNVSNFSTYRGNLLLKRAIERELEIIGEAMNRILKQSPEMKELIPEAKSIIGLRNYIIHAYDSISDENIWAILTNHLPDLKSQVTQLLKK